MRCMSVSVLKWSLAEVGTLLRRWAASFPAERQRQSTPTSILLMSRVDLVTPMTSSTGTVSLACLGEVGVFEVGVLDHVGDA